MIYTLLNYTVEQDSFSVFTVKCMGTLYLFLIYL